MADEKEGWITGAAKAWLLGLAGAAGTAAFAWWQPARDWLLWLVGAIWTHMGASSFPNWSWYLLALISAHALVKLAMRWRQTSDEDSHERFTEMRLFGVLWRWRYISGRPSSYTPYCPHCDTRLIGQYQKADVFYGIEDEVSYHCDHCNSNLYREACTPRNLDSRVERQVERVLRTGEWREHVRRDGKAGG